MPISGTEPLIGCFIVAVDADLPQINNNNIIINTDENKH